LIVIREVGQQLEKQVVLGEASSGLRDHPEWKDKLTDWFVRCHLNIESTQFGVVYDLATHTQGSASQEYRARAVRIWIL
jgi:hypothetical protein